MREFNIIDLMRIISLDDAIKKNEKFSIIYFFSCSI